ncbi:hypothetical protein ACOMHN_040769 [Nucella lapillus]
MGGISAILILSGSPSESRTVDNLGMAGSLWQGDVVRGSQ